MQGTHPGHGRRRQTQAALLSSLRWLAWLLLAGLLAAWPSRAQQAVQFFPDDLPATAANVTQRLIFRTSGLRQFWDEEYVTTARLQERIVLAPDNWQQTFAATGGVAVLSPVNAKGGVFRITSGLNDTQEGQQYTRNWLDFSNMAGAMLVESGGRLRFDNVGLSGIAPTYAYKYSVHLPYRNAGLGYALWPTILLAPNATVSLRNVSVNYMDPSNIDTPEQYAAKVVFGMRQQYGSNSVTEVNSTAATVVGPLIIKVFVLNGSTNSTTGNGTATGGNDSVLAYAYFENVTFNCEPWPAASTGLSRPALAAAIAVPVVVGVLLVAGLAAWGYRRRRRHQQAVRASKVAKDIEAGRMQSSAEHAYASRDLQPPRDAALGAVYVPAGGPGGTPHGSGGSSTGEGASGSTDHTGASAATPSGAKTPIVLSSMQRAAMQNSSAESNDADFSGTGVAQGPTYGFAEPAAAAASPHPGAAAAAAAAAFQAEGLSPSSSRQLWQNTLTASHSGSGSAAVCLGETSSYDTVGLERASTGRIASDDGPQARGSQHTPSVSARNSLEVAAVQAGTPGSARSSIEHPAVNAAVSKGGSVGRGSGGSTRSIASQHSGLVTERSGSGGTTGAVGDTGSGSVLGTGSVVGASSRVLDRQGGMSALLKARSELAVLRDLKIGPLLGRGSYGRVYKGRWKAVTVAVKIIEHSEGSPGTASSGDKRISIGRETFVATNISHPNVVQTYHISTMTISQRNALASTWLKETAGGTSSNSAAHLAAAVASRQLAETDDTADIEPSDSSQSSQSSAADQPEILETWMLLEFCEKGSLHKAIQQGKFIRKDNQQPDMIGIYKALLDTASGLDYLHSIGVVHGDLKTANVLLKGSARDVRGFACKIADFGLSRVLDMDATHISTRTYGTIVYMPAELLLTGRMTTATDIYSFGLMMWELFTSQPVFEEGLSVGQIFYMIAYQNWRPTVPPNCPPGYAQIMAACWHQDPEQRPSVQQLLRLLQRLYVAEKQRVIAAKQAAAVARSAGTTSTASSNSPSTAGSPRAAVQRGPAAQAVSMTATVQPTSPPAPLSVVAAVAQQAAASAARAVAALAVPDDSANATAGTTSDAAGLQPLNYAAARAAALQEKDGDRTSFESTSSDRYANAAAASEASIAAPGLPQWSYPGQLTPSGAGATPVDGSPGEATPTDNTPEHSSPGSSTRLSTDAVGSAGAAASAGPTPAAIEPASPPAAAPEPAAVLGGSSYQPSRQSFGSSVGSAGAAQGSEGAARSSGGTAGAHEEYQPWAHAVSEEGLVRAGSRMVATRQRCAPLPGHWMGRLSLAAEHPPQQGERRQETARQQQQQPEAHQSEQQQESRLGALLHQALGPHAAPAVALGAYGPLHFTSELPPIDDNEPIEDTIPSESLFPPATMSSSSNAVFGPTDDLAGYEDTSGFLAAMRRAPAHARRQRHPQLSAVRPVVPAAQSFVEALDMVSGHGGGNHSYYQPTPQVPQHVSYAAGAAGTDGLPGQQVGGSTGGTVPPGAPSSTVQGTAGMYSPTLSSLLPDSISGWGSSGVTTGTMPSVLGDDTSTARSSGTFGGMSRLGTQESTWQPSSSSSLEGRPAAMFSPTAGYGGRHGTSQYAAIASPFSPTNLAPAAVVPSSTAASPFAAPNPAGSDAAPSTFAQYQCVAAPAVHVSSPAASFFAQQQAVAAPATPASGSAASPFAQAAGVPVTRAAPVPPATPATTGRSPFAVAAVHPPHVTASHIHSPVSSGYGTAGSSSAGSTPERQRTPPREIRFLYRTPSGRVIAQSRSTGTLQTVREGSGTESKTSSGTESRAGSGTTASKADSAATAGSRAASLYPAASQDYVQRQKDGQQASPPQQGLSNRQGGPAPSPFAALAQRAGSLFGPG